MLPRKSAFERRAAGTAHAVQVVAANVDVVFLCMALVGDFNLRRLERYLSVAWGSGAVPVIVLTKADLCDDLPARLEEVTSVCAGARVLSCSSLEEEGFRVWRHREIPPNDAGLCLGQVAVAAARIEPTFFMSQSMPFSAMISPETTVATYPSAV